MSNSCIASNTEVNGDETAIGYYDVEGGSYFGINNNWWSNNGVPETTNISHNPLPELPPDCGVKILSTYGILTDVTGIPASFSVPYIGNGKAWTGYELEQVIIGVENVAEAFNRLRYTDADPNQHPSGTSQQAKTLFFNVMDTPDVANPDLDGFYLLRVENGFQYGNDPDCDYAQDVACTSNGNAAIAFYGQFYQVGDVHNVQYTTVHELGHRFDNQSSIGGGTSLSVHMGLNSSFAVFDCAPDGTGASNREILFGLFRGSWERGKRGWGSIATDPPTGFQQNPLREEGTTELEIREAAADMFLNWIYRRNTHHSPNWIGTVPECGGPSELGDNPISGWQGFRNIQDNGGADLDAEPGNVRYWWLEQKLNVIFSQQLGWTNESQD